MVDPNDDELSNPIFLAELLAKDLNLPESMINAIAISIVEQVHGLKVNDNVQGMVQVGEQLHNGKYKECSSGASSDENIPTQKNKLIKMYLVLGLLIEKNKVLVRVIMMLYPKVSN